MESAVQRLFVAPCLTLVGAALTRGGSRGIPPLLRTESVRPARAGGRCQHNLRVPSVCGRRERALGGAGRGTRLLGVPTFGELSW